MTTDMENWFLRGGERPQENGMRQAPVVTCQNCGGDNLADEECCTHCGAALTGGTSTGEYCGSEHGENPCDECDGLTRCDDCPHNCDDDDDDEVEDAHMFSVTMERTLTVRQTATVRVEADCEDSAMDRAEELAEEDSDGWDWKDIPDTADYEDCEAVEAEEAD